MTAKQAFILGMLIGLAIGACWMYMHMSCPSCQSKWDYIRRRLGLKMIE